MEHPSSGTRRNSGFDAVNIHALAKATRKTLERLAPFCLLRPTGLAQDVALTNKVVDKIKTFVNGIDLSMLATQMSLSLANEALKLSETKSPEEEWSMVPRRADNGLGKLALLAALGDQTAKKAGNVFKDVRQDIYKIAAMTKEKKSVMVLVPLDPEQADHNVTKSLRDVGLDLNANLNLLIDFSHLVEGLQKWWSFVREELEAAAAAAALTSDPNVQPASPTSPGAMDLPPALNADMWLHVQTEYHSYFRIIQHVQGRYTSLLTSSNEAWQSSARAIPLSPSSESNSSRASSPNQSSAPAPATKLEVNQTQTPTTPTSPSTYYDATSRPMSNAYDDSQVVNAGNGQANKNGGERQGKKKRGFTLTSSLHKSSSAAGLTTDPKLSIKKMRTFLFTRTVPRPEVRGLFPGSAKISVSRSRSTGAVSEHEKGKGKGKEKGSLNGNATLDVPGGGDAEKMTTTSVMGLAPSTIVLQEKSPDSEEPAAGSSALKEKGDTASPPPSPPPLSRSHSRLSAKSHPQSLLMAEKSADPEPAADPQPSAEPGPVIDEQTAAKSRGGFAVFQFAETLVRAGAKRLLCGSCFGYGD